MTNTHFYHGHVDNDAVAGFHTLRAQDLREPADVLQQFGICYLLNRARNRTVINKRCLHPLEQHTIHYSVSTAISDVTIDSIVTHTEFPAIKPAGQRST